MIVPFADVAVLVFLAAGGLASAVMRKLTWRAAVSGVLLGFCIYKGAGYPGIVMLAAFFTGNSGNRVSFKAEIRIKDIGRKRRPTYYMAGNCKCWCSWYLRFGGVAIPAKSSCI